MSLPSSHDVEQLSAYLDGQLSRPDSARLESRLKTDPQLRSIYHDLRQSRALLRKLPARRAPRNFTLTPKMAGIKPPLPRAFPIFRLASALAAILLFFGYAANLSFPVLTSIRAAAPAPAFAVGGGAPAEPAMEAAYAATEAPAMEATQASPAQQDNLALTSTPEAARVLVAPTGTAVEPGDQQKMIPNDHATPEFQPESFPWPVPPGWLFGLLTLTVLTGATAFFVRTQAERNWNKANAVKSRQPAAKEFLILGLVLLGILLLGAGIYWMSTLTF